MTQLGEAVFTAPEPVEPPLPEIKEITIRFSLFFDGTLNNRNNTNERLKNSGFYHVYKGEDSFENDLSNVAIMESYIDKADTYDYSYHTYIEGSGTENFKGDSRLGAAVGQWKTGVEKKVNNGMRNIIDKIREDGTIKPSDFKITRFTIDVFGFSRGAATARYFIYKALSTKRTPGRSGRNARPLDKRLKMIGFQGVKEVDVCFVGLYDTVASHGINHKDDTETLKLDAIATFKAKKVLQLASADEHRHNFSLTDISSVAGSGKEIFLPGVHADIGGSYRDDVSEQLTLKKSDSLSEIKADRALLIKQGWYKENEISIPPRGKRERGPRRYKLIATRHGISNAYSKIPLNIMARFARENGIKLVPRFNDREKVPSGFLSTVFSDLDAYANQSGSSVAHWQNHQFTWLKQLRHQYCHFSAHYGKVLRVVATNKPNIDNGKRIRVTNYG